MRFFCARGTSVPGSITGECELVSRVFSKFLCGRTTLGLGAWPFLAHLFGLSWCTDLRRMLVCVYGLRLEPRGVERGIGSLFFRPFPLFSLCVGDSCLEPFYRDMGHPSPDLTKVLLCLILRWATVGRGFFAPESPPILVQPGATRRDLPALSMGEHCAVMMPTRRHFIPRGHSIALGVPSFSFRFLRMLLQGVRFPLDLVVSRDRSLG